jgi:hypothetical protein
MLFVSMINMNMFFEFMSMMLKNHMFKIDLSKMQLDVFFYFASCLKKQNRFQVNEILELFNFSLLMSI